MKLKTLKDLETRASKMDLFTSTAQDSFKEVLKAEAIKWVKDCCPDDNIGGRPLRKEAYCVGCERLIEFIDITSEDLK